MSPYAYYTTQCKYSKVIQNEIVGKGPIAKRDCVIFILTEKETGGT